MVELVGGDYLASDIEVMAQCGRVILIGTMAGSSTHLDMGAVLSKRLRIQGTVLRSRPLAEKIATTDRFRREVIPMLRAGLLKPVVDKVFRIEDVRAAHQHMEANSNSGKIVVTIDENL
ncbi:MAG: hypothetical protein NVS9B15_01800 [Acidobacteriaceae bacterium]